KNTLSTITVTHQKKSGPPPHPPASTRGRHNLYGRELFSRPRFRSAANPNNDIRGLEYLAEQLIWPELFSGPRFRSAAKSFNIFNQQIIKSLIYPLHRIYEKSPRPHDKKMQFLASTTQKSLKLRCSQSYYAKRR
ncbi:MAG: hypothetical protein ABF687_04160, partial [Lentilactobacillus diolivorans]